MTSSQIQHKSRELFKNYNVSPPVILSYELKWAKSVKQLGDKWLLAKPIIKSN